MDAFLDAFWPNVAATLVGVVLGLPVALWVNRLATSRSTADARAAQELRVDHALQVLTSAFESNTTLLRDYSDVLAASKVRWNIGLDLSAWSAIREDLAAELTDPAFRRKVAFHFSQLSLLRRLNDEYLGFAFGTNASMSSAEQTKTSIRSNMQSLCDQLHAEAVELSLACKEARRGLVPGAR